MTTTTTEAATSFYTLAQVAALCHVSTQTIERLLRERKLPPAVKVGRRWLIAVADMTDWLRARSEQAG
jgi:excisionase family DNA binding protein